MRRDKSLLKTQLYLGLLITLVVGALFCGDAAGQVGDYSLLTFGSGKVRVRLYSDYFCGACGKLEPMLDEIVEDLVKKNKVTFTFVDTPVHKHSPLYARYFLYILNEKKDLKHALAARAALFEAAQAKIAEADKLEEFLKKKGIKFAPFDFVPVFKSLEAFIKEDKINATPTSVIMTGTKKESFQGANPIAAELGKLRQ
jgi:thiol:disulfide interchange protein DsbA